MPGITDIGNTSKMVTLTMGLAGQQDAAPGFINNRWCADQGLNEEKVRGGIGKASMGFKTGQDMTTVVVRKDMRL
jgi:hypothetical protein